MRRAPSLLLLLVTVACAGAAPPTTPAAPAPAATPAVAVPAPVAATAPALDDPIEAALRAFAITSLPDDIRWVGTSAEYEAACWQAYAIATERLEELAAGRAAGTWAVSVDADETILSNVVYEIERVPAGGAYDRAVWKLFVERQLSTAVVGARPFLERVQALGGQVVVVTNRREDERAATAANLRSERLPYDLLLMRGNDAPGDKNPRWEAVAAGTAAPGVPPLEILLWVGDNIHDFPRLDQSLKDEPESALAPFGDRYVLVPNPLYGSWKG